MAIRVARVKEQDQYLQDSPTDMDGFDWCLSYPPGPQLRTPTPDKALLSPTIRSTPLDCLPWHTAPPPRGGREESSSSVIPPSRSPSPDPLVFPWQIWTPRKVHSNPRYRPHLPEYPGVNDEEIEIFLDDAPFNFTISQLVDHTSDPGLIADVALYRHLTYHQIQEKYIKGHELYDQELKGVRQRLIAGRARTRIHEAMIQLTSQNQLDSRHLWMGLLGLDVHSRAQTPPNLWNFAMNRDLEVQAYIPVPIPPPSHLSEVDKASPPPLSLYWVNHSEDHYTAGKRHINICPHCSENGHFGRECNTPHIYCADRGYCKVREKTECPYPCNHSLRKRLYLRPGLV